MAKQNKIELNQNEQKGFVLESVNFRENRPRKPKYGRFVLDSQTNEVKLNIGTPHKPNWASFGGGVSQGDGNAYNADITVEGGTGGTGLDFTPGTNLYWDEVAYRKLHAQIDLRYYSNDNTQYVRKPELFRVEVEQVAHGFSVGEAVRLNGSIHVLAQGDDIDNSDVIGIVVQVTDVDNFIYQYGGLWETTGYTSGENYFLSPAVAGSVVSEPTYTLGEVRTFIGTGTPDGLLIEIALGEEVMELTSTGTDLTEEVNQSSHGFSAGDAIRHNGTIYVKAQADSVSNAGAIGIVIEVADSNNFTYQYGGFVNIGSWTDGASYFLSPTIAGLVITEPTYTLGEVREFIGTGTPSGLLLEIDLGEEVMESTAVTGSGTLNYIPKWTPDGYTLGDSQFIDNGVTLGLGIVPQTDQYLTITTSTQNVSLYVTNTHTDGGVVQIALSGISSGGGVGDVGLYGEGSGSGALNIGISGKAYGSSNINYAGYFLATTSTAGTNYGIYIDAQNGTTDTWGIYVNNGYVYFGNITDGSGDFLTAANGGGRVYQRTPAEVLSDIGAASTSHNHALDDLSNVLIVAKSHGDMLRWDNIGGYWYNTPFYDTNTTYNISAETGTGGANLRLTDSSAATDDVLFAEGTDIGIARTDANTITISYTGSGGITYPGAGVAISTGSAWDTSATGTIDRVVTWGTGGTTLATGVMRDNGTEAGVYSSSTDYTFYVLNSGTHSTSLRIQQTGTSSQEYGVYSNVTGVSTNNYAFFASASGATGSNYSFYGNSGGFYNYDIAGFGVSPVDSRQVTISTGSLQYGLHVSNTWSGTSSTYGVFAYTLGTTTNNYGLSFSAQGAGLNNFGLYGFATNATSKNVAGRFRAYDISPSAATSIGIEVVSEDAHTTVIGIDIDAKEGTSTTYGIRNYVDTISNGTHYGYWVDVKNSTVANWAIYVVAGDTYLQKTLLKSVSDYGTPLGSTRILTLNETDDSVEYVDYSEFGGGGITGTGTSNYSAVWDVTDTSLKQGSLRDNGTTIAWGTSPQADTAFELYSSSSSISTMLNFLYQGGHSDPKGIYGIVSVGAVTTAIGVYGRATITSGISYGVVGRAVGGTAYAFWAEAGKVKLDDVSENTSPTTGTKILSLNGSGVVEWVDFDEFGGGGMTYPGAGVAVSTGSAWATSATGTANYITKWGTGGTTLSNSLIQDDGSNLSIGTTINADRFLNISTTESYGLYLTIDASSARGIQVIGTGSGVKGVYISSNADSNTQAWGIDARAQGGTVSNVAVLGVAAVATVGTNYGGWFQAQNGATNWGIYVINGKGYFQDEVVLNTVTDYGSPSAATKVLVLDDATSEIEYVDYSDFGSGGMTYPGAGVAISTGSAWATSGTGTDNYLVRWKTSNGLENSLIRDDGSNISIGEAIDSNAYVNIRTASDIYALKVDNDSNITGSLYAGYFDVQGATASISKTAVYAAAGNDFGEYAFSAGAGPSLFKGIEVATVSKTSNYTADAEDCVILVDAGSTSVTITLPACSSSNYGHIYILKCIDKTNTAKFSSTSNIDGSSSDKTFSATWNSYIVVSTSEGWIIAAEKEVTVPT